MWLILVLLIPTYYFLRYLWELVQLPGLSRRALFISGADRGFGHLLALKCAANGMPVFAGCLTDEGREGLTAKAKRLSGTLHVLPLDVRDEDSVRAAAKYVQEHLTGGQYLWAVVNNAGVLPMCPDAWSDMSDIHQAMNVNCYGMIRVTHAFLPMLKKSKGRVVSASSICGRYALPGVAGYTISKYGVEAYMDSIRLV
ncbi:DHS-16 protein [Aphelenchoides avenae]|nr:DHS-16 protein [Aphelenchus avenae]